MKKRMPASHKYGGFNALLFMPFLFSCYGIVPAGAAVRGGQPGDQLSSPPLLASYEQQISEKVLSGEDSAKRITQRYADTQKVCKDGKAAFWCHGVLLRVTDAGETWHSWNPSTAAVKRNGVSFYYLSAGNGIKTLGYTGVGLIFSELEASPKYTLTARCAYPSNGYSDARSDSCNARRGYPKSAPCDEQGIDTVDKWVKHYRNSGSGKYQCSFKTDKEAFSLSQEARNHFPRPSDRDAGNELVFAAWPQDIPERLAIDAIFYQISGDIEKARYIQQDFYRETHKILPVLHVDLSAPDDEKFTWHAEDQAVE